MDSPTSPPGTPLGGPLQALTPDRVNQQQHPHPDLKRDSSFFRSNSHRDSTVHDKISQFNNMSGASVSRQLERKTADAALKRAMMGREEAETETRRLRDELKALRKGIDDGRERERRVGERLEAVMENYGRAKETHTHTQTLWEKEIRRARKETFKSQSGLVKLQEELKSARSAAKSLEENYRREKERSRVREQEAFEARYQIVGVQEQLEQALEGIKLVEQERDAYKTAAKNEEVARIAAEGRLPLPPSRPDDEFASPPKKKQLASLKKRKLSGGGRVSLSMFEIESSAASEMEIEELGQQVAWEKQRADRAQEMIEFLQTECQMSVCACGRSSRNAVVAPAAVQPEEATIEEVDEEEEEQIVVEAVEVVIEEDLYVEEPGTPLDEEDVDETIKIETPVEEPEMVEEVVEPVMEEMIIEDVHHEDHEEAFEEEHRQSTRGDSNRGPRRSTIFCPEEGTFRTVPDPEMEAQIIIEHPADDETETEPPTPVEDDMERDTRMYARTPSVEPPTFAVLAQQRSSLMSLLNAPHNDAHSAPLPSSFSVPVMDASDYENIRPREDEEEGEENEVVSQPRASLEDRPHTSATLYSVTTTTTSVPLADESRKNSYSFSEKLRTPSSSSNASFDTTNPALTPTMTREQALAKIRERRGRARSAAQGAATPAKKMTQGSTRRDLSAPQSRGAGKAGR